MKGCWDIRLARGGKKMAAKKVKYNREQCSVAAIVRATSAIAIWEHWERKLKRGSAAKLQSACFLI